MAEIFPYVEDCQNYDEIVATICQIFAKQKNNVYTRHRLVDRRQDPGESIADFLLALTQLAKDCIFSAVTANECREEVIRDSFINGLASPLSVNDS